MSRSNSLMEYITILPMRVNTPARKLQIPVERFCGCRRRGLRYTGTRLATDVSRRRRFLKEGREEDEQAAVAVARWLQRADQSGSFGIEFRGE